jgi:hypothetical protein
LDGRQQYEPPGTKVSVAGQRAGMLEPKDQGQAWWRPRSRMGCWWPVTPQPDHNTPAAPPQGIQCDARVRARATRGAREEPAGAREQPASRARRTREMWCLASPVQSVPVTPPPAPALARPRVIRAFVVVG